MNILLLAATEAEIAISIKYIAEHWKPLPEQCFEKKGTVLSICITGVGMVATTYALTKELQDSKYDLVIQAGIAGSITDKLVIGEVVAVESEYFADLGADDNGQFVSIFDLGFLEKDQYPFVNSVLPSKPIGNKMKVVHGSTVNTVTGSSLSVSKVKKNGRDIETMEGAAFHYVCLLEKVPFIQMRAISNYVEPRNRENWNIPLAIKNLNEELIEFLQHLSDKQ